MLASGQLPHPRVPAAPGVTRLIGEVGEQVPGVRVQGVNAVDVPPHGVEEVGEQAQLQLPARAVAGDDGSDIAPPRHLVGRRLLGRRSVEAEQHAHFGSVPADGAQQPTDRGEPTAGSQQQPLAGRSARCACSALSAAPTAARNSSRSMRRPPSHVPVTCTCRSTRPDRRPTGRRSARRSRPACPPRGSRPGGRDAACARRRWSVPATPRPVRRPGPRRAHRRYGCAG